MNIILYTNSSDRKVADKRLTQLASLTGTLRDECSIVNPVISIGGLSDSDAKNCNYAYISNFGRYYYINDVIFKGNLKELHLHCDVLTSFKSNIRALDGVVSRQENEYNLYLQDGMFRTYQNPHISVVPFPNGFDSFNYVLSVAGANGGNNQQNT